MNALMSRTCSRGHEFKGNDPCPKCYPGYRTFKLHAKLWMYPAESSQWYFLTVPKEKSEKIKERFGSFARGWGSLRVLVTIGKSVWKTSVFPDKKRGAYLLPIKASVRKAENLPTGKSVSFTLEVLDS